MARDKPKKGEAVDRVIRTCGGCDFLIFQGLIEPPVKLCGYDKAKLMRIPQETHAQPPPANCPLRRNPLLVRVHGQVLKQPAPKPVKEVERPDLSRFAINN